MWYAVNMMYRSEHKPPIPENQILWEESLVLFDASNEEEAKKKAHQLVTTGEAAYTSSTGDEVCWQFVEIQKVYQIGEDLRDGVELFSRFLRNSEANSLLQPFSE